MHALIKSELRALDLAYNNKNRVLIYGFLAIGIPIIVWLLGPRLLGFYDAEGFKTSISVVGMVLVMQTVSNSLGREKDGRRMIFLQTLPVNKSQIVSAKFISVFLFSGIMIVWMNMVILLTTFIGDVGMDENGLLLGFFSSLTMFIAGITLMAYFYSGSRFFMIGIISIFIWGGVHGLSGLYLKRMGMEPGIEVFAVYMSLSLAVYLICWLLSVRRVTKKGFPLNEGYKTDRMKPLEGGSK